MVALRKESVDRNPLMCFIKQMPLMSLSARRAWIEMINGCNPDFDGKVALRKESVDRNVFLTLTVCNVSMSLSARRAWIEMVKSSYQLQP